MALSFHVIFFSLKTQKEGLLSKRSPVTPRGSAMQTSGRLQPPMVFSPSFLTYPPLLFPISLIFLLFLRKIPWSFHAADERLPVPEDKIWHRNSDRIHSHRLNPHKIPLRNIFRTVYPDSRFIYFPGKLCCQIIFVLRCCVFCFLSDPILRNARLFLYHFFRKI